MTKKIFKYIFLLLAMGPVLTACNDDDDNIDYTKYYGWRDKNNSLADNLYKDVLVLGENAYFNDTIESLSDPLCYTLCRSLEKANEDSLRKIGKWYSPYYNSKVRVHYTLYDSRSVMDRLEEYGVLNNRDSRNDQKTMDKIFGIGYSYGMAGYEVKADTLESSQVKYFDTTCSDVVKGWQDCLQHMHIGDNWLVCIPWYLGYGQPGSGNIDPYSNLYFRIKLVDITSLGDNK